MIISLTSSAEFSDSGASLSGRFQPRTGLTAVVGDNGKGKTFLTIETTRWLLFGKKALRGAASDYAKAEAEGVFELRGARYTIHRGKNEWLADTTGKKLAIGAEKVTEKVVEMLGYGLEVFDLCNAATQGNMQRLGDLRPAERKAVIDKVLRLTDSELAEKACREEAKNRRRAAEALTGACKAPGEEPKPPTDYVPSHTLRPMLVRLRATAEEAERLRTQIKGVTFPERPVVGVFSEQSIAELTKQELDRQLATARLAQLRSAEAPIYTDEQISIAEARRAHDEDLASRGPKPTMLSTEILKQLDVWNTIDVLAKVHREDTECPKCGHAFRTGAEAPPPPPTSRADLAREKRALESWANPYLPYPDGLDLTPAQIAASRLAEKAAAEAADLEQKLKALPDQSEELSRQRADKAALEAWAALQLRAERAQAANEAAQSALNALGDVPSLSELNTLYERLSASERYEAECKTYDTLVENYRTLQAQIADELRLAVAFKEGADELAAARAEVKAVIAPRISRIASSLIYDMTLGKLTSVTVSDDMEVTVGRQRIETLSGAGKTVANLALRIAFGQALVAHSFPVFLGDEIDSDLSESRREATLMAMAALKKHLKQIILVTHRDVAIADHVHEV